MLPIENASPGVAGCVLIIDPVQIHSDCVRRSGLMIQGDQNNYCGDGLQKDHDSEDGQRCHDQHGLVDVNECLDGRKRL